MIAVLTRHCACVASQQLRTSSSVVCEKSSYHCPTAENGSGVRAQTISSVIVGEFLAPCRRADRHGDDDPGRPAAGGRPARPRASSTRWPGRRRPG